MRSRTLLFVSVSISLMLPVVASAAMIPFFGPIIPQTGGQATCAAGWGMLIDVINRTIAFLLTLTIVAVAPIMIAYSGFLYVVNPVNPSGRSQANKVLLNTIVGIVIALAGWMIVAAVMAVLYHPTDPGLAGKAWSDLITGNPSDVCIPLAGSLAPAVVTPPPAVTPVTPGKLVSGFATGCSTSNDQNVTTLVSYGVTGHSSGNCCDRTQSTCTSLDGMGAATVTQIVNVKGKCGAVTVTGGTEVGHSGEGTLGSHSGGSKVDIGQNVVSCVLGTSGSSSVSPPTFGSSQAKDKCGNVYTWEGNHTDIYVKSACSL